MQGNLSAVVSSQEIVWNEHEVSPYGPLTTPKIKPKLLSIAQAHLWQSKCVDPTGYVWLGARYYHPQTGRFLSPDPVSHPACLDLYVYANGDPVNYSDPDGRFASAVYQPIQATFLNTWNNPRIQGGLQAFGGFAEASAGVSLTSTPFAPLGIAMFVHGADHFAAGGYAMATGSNRATATEQFFEKAGMSPEWASFSNDILSLGGFTSSLGLARNFSNQSSRALSQAAMSSLEISANSFEGLQTGKNFKSFTKANCRKNLIELTGISPPRTVHAHHVFPQLHENFFSKRSINIHHPAHMTWWEESTHLSNARKYNDAWKEFIRKQADATPTQIFDNGKQLMSKQGIEVNY